jgi:myo-inositol-1(or 4)-monophosphatase
MYGMLSSGLVDIVVEDTLKTHDYMALVPIIQGAGGIITDKYNNSITLDSDGSVLATANSLIHKQAVNIINL